MQNYRTRTLASVAFLATTFLSSVGHTQAFNDPDFRRSLVGPGNIDPKTGSFSYERTDLSVGAGEFPSRLQLKRWQRSTLPYGVTNPMGGFDHNFNVSIGCSGGSNYPGPCPYNGNRLVRVGPVVHSFRSTASGWVSEYGDGEQLVEETDRFIFRGRTGDQIIFPKDPNFYNYEGTTHLASVWEKANGESLVFSYEVAIKAASGWNPERRLVSVINSRGFGFRFNYLLAGNATREGSLNLSFNDWRRKTVSSVQAIAPGCTAGTSVTCDSSALGAVNYTYSQWPTSTVTSGLRMDGMTDPDGKQTTFTWSSDKRVESESNPAVPGASHFRNSYVNGAVTQQTDGNGKIWHFRRTTQADGTLLAEIEDPLSKITKYSYAVGKAAPEWVDDPLNNRSKYTYDDKMRVATSENPAGLKTAYSRDERGNITKVVSTPASGSYANQPQLSVEFKYALSCDSSNWRICNLPIETIDERLNSTVHSYDPSHGGVVSTLAPGDTPAKRTLTKVNYASFYRAPSVETSSSVAPIREMVLPISTEICLSSNGTETYSCPVADQIVSTVTYTPSTALSRSQALPVTLTSDPNGIAAQTGLVYDAVGNVVKVDGPRAGNDVVSLSYDKSRRTTRRLHPDPDDFGPLAAPETVLRYDDAGRLSAVSAKLNGAEVVTSYGYDGNGALTSKTDPSTGSTNYIRDDVGRLKEVSKVVDGVSRRETTQYDAAGRPTEIRKAVGSADEVLDTILTYNAHGKVDTLRDGKGNVTTFCFDGYGRPVETRFPSTAVPGASPSCASVPIGSMPEGADYQSVGLDPSSNPVSIRLRDGRTVAQTFDASGRLQSRDAPDQDLDTSYEYDLAGRLLNATAIGAPEKTVTSTYDKVGRILSSTTNGKTVSYSYAADNSSIRLIHPDGKFVTYKYDVLGRVSELLGISEIDTGGLQAPQLALFAYDQLSRRTRINRGNDTFSESIYGTNQKLAEMKLELADLDSDLHKTFTYNNAGEIKSAVIDNNAYTAPIEAPSSKSYVVNGLNQYKSADGVAAIYDRRGNLISLGSKSFIYDNQNHLVQANDGTSVASLAYDALGRLSSVTSSTGKTNLFYAGTTLIGEYDDAGNITRRYVHGSGGSDPLVAYEGNTKKWLYADERGSIIGSADAGGNRVGSASYGLYGEATGLPVSRFGYTGQIYLPELKLYQSPTRTYDPSLGRYLQSDPLGYADGNNQYAYVGGDPVNLVDPEGTTATPYDLPPVRYEAPAPASPSYGWAPTPWWAYGQRSDFGGQAALRALFDGLGRGQGWLRMQARAGADYLKQGICVLPAFGAGGAMSGYYGLGGGVSGGLSFEPKNGQVTLGAGVDVGAGVGGKVDLVSARQYQASIGGTQGWNGSVAATGNVQLGPISFGASREIVGTSAQKGSPSTTITGNVKGWGFSGNVNLTGSGGYTTPSIYDLGCK